MVEDDVESEGRWKRSFRNLDDLLKGVAAPERLSHECTAEAEPVYTSSGDKRAEIVEICGRGKAGCS